MPTPIAVLENPQPPARQQPSFGNQLMGLQNTLPVAARTGTPGICPLCRVHGATGLIVQAAMRLRIGQ